ncbi:uncharacterized protein LOC113100648 [Carassius auratus]|uniref:Uncharacterized protein LOC113100648 n=1 Tax=Carassius auratus TaxID=7957 RepID=A0A6P6PHJ5_CARAU|nr:uncharacterized protein LOC113100648 [Carassius auratus]
MSHMKVLEFMKKNFGPFSQFVSLTDLISINRLFDPLETLDNLTPKQVAGLLVEELPGLPEKKVVINTVFDHLFVSPVERGLPDVLQNLLSISQMTIIPCSSYILIFQRLFQALPFLPTEMETVVFQTTGELKQNGARDSPIRCIVSAPCSVDLQQYVCSSLTGITAGNLAELLKCQLSSSRTYSKEIWKLFFTKANDVLDGALVIFSSAAANMSQPIRGDVVSQVLDVVGELRLERISPDQWTDLAFISMLLGQYLKPFLPFASPSLLLCTSSKNLSCQTYQHILSEVPLVNEIQGRDMANFFILPFLRRNATDAGCVATANNSVEWLQKNFGPFSQFVSPTDLISINRLFDPLETLDNLTPKQVAGLLVEELPGLPEKKVVINTVFDHLFVSPVERGLPDVLQNLLSISQTTIIPCSSYILIFQRLFQALPFLPTEMETVVFQTTGELKQNGARDCSLPEPPTCLVTPANVTRVCSGVNSNETLLSAALVSAPCSVDLQQYVCSSLTGITAGNLAELLKCQLSSSRSYSKEIWKLFFTKANDVLDGALVIFSSAAANMSQPIRGDVVSQVLDVVGELRLERISPDQWTDLAFISMLLGQYLKPFLPFASPSLLLCTSSKNLSCQTYQHILSEVPLVNEIQGRDMANFFILPFLRRNATDAGCVATANNSVEWLQKNFGPFSQFVSLTDLISINRLFDPLETLDNLTPKQVAGLLVEELPGLPEKKVVINTVFDHLFVSPVERGLPDVLQNLLSISQMTIIPCSSYILIFQRLFQALPFLPTEMETVVFQTTGELKQNGARDCSLPEPPTVPEPPTCLFTPVNATRVCSGVNSNETLLSALTGITAGNLAELLKCQLSSSRTYSKEIWKLFFTKANDVLDGALVIFSSAAANMSQPIRGDVVSQVLDVVGELRLERISPDQWTDLSFISMLLGQYLKPFLPFASPSLLLCTSSKNLSCQTYQHILSEVPLVNEIQGRDMANFFILPFLRRNATDAGCVATANNSVEWLQKNFGPFSQFVSLTDLISINRLFDPVCLHIYTCDFIKDDL